MSNYTYIPSIKFGQYIPIDTTLHRLDPRIKVLLSITVILCASLSQSFITLSIIFSLVMLGSAISRMSILRIIKTSLKIIPFLLIIAVLQLLFSFTEDVNVLFVLFNRFVISVDDFLHLGLLFYRFFILLFSVQLFTTFTSISQFTNGLEHLLRPLTYLKIPVSDLVMVVHIALRFTPSLGNTLNSITRAQASRGADMVPMNRGKIIQRVKQIVPMLVPMFVTSLQQSEKIALAMDARAYGIEIRRTSLNPMKWKFLDWIALLICFSLVVVTIYL